MKISVLAPLAVGALALSWALAQGPLQAQTAPAADAATPNESMTEVAAPTEVVGMTAIETPSGPVAVAADPAPTVGAFDGVIRALSSGDLKAGKTLLQKMKADGLGGDQITRWETLASRTAVRSGDAQWLKQINEESGLNENADEVTMISIMRLIFANRLSEARSMLLAIEDPDAMSEIPRRRYEELWLKLEQLSGDKEAEAKWAEKLVEFVSHWDEGRCQSCHANPRKTGTDVTHFDLKNWWIGERYVVLLNDIGDAKAAQREAIDALAKNGDDEAARIKLGYALRAQGNNAQSEAELRKISWSQWDDKQFKKPLRLGQFP